MPPLPSASILCALLRVSPCTPTCKVCLNKQAFGWVHISNCGHNEDARARAWKNYPKASTVTAHVTTAVDPAAARLSFLQVLRWYPPRNFDTTPITPANKANNKKNIVAPLPPKPVHFLSPKYQTDWAVPQSSACVVFVCVSERKRERAWAY